MNIDVLKAYSSLVSKLEGATKIKDDTLEGDVILNNEVLSELRLLSKYELCESTFDLYENGMVSTSVDLDEIYDKHFDYLIKVELVRTHVHDNFFICDNWNVLLKYSKYLQNPVTAVYFYDSKKLVTSSSDDDLFNNYLNVSTVCNLIDSVANISSGDERIIIYKRDVTLSYQVDEADLRYKIDVGSLEHLLDKDVHYEAKKGLVRKELVEYLSNINKSARFGHLIRHFNAFSMTLSLSYHSYVEDYSFDKVRKEYQEKKTTYVERINNIFDDVSTKLLSIPAGIWLASTQIKAGDLTSLEFIKNLSVCAVVIVLFIIMVFSLFGQFSIFGVLKQEYQGLFERLKSDYPKEKKQIDDIVKALAIRETIVMTKLGVTLIASIVLIVLLFVMMSVAIT